MIKKIGAGLIIMGLNGLLVNAFACSCSSSNYTSCTSAGTSGYYYSSSTCCLATRDNSDSLWNNYSCSSSDRGSSVCEEQCKELS